MLAPSSEKGLGFRVFTCFIFRLQNGMTSCPLIVRVTGQHIGIYRSSCREGAPFWKMSSHKRPSFQYLGFTPKLELACLTHLSLNAFVGIVCFGSVFWYAMLLLMLCSPMRAWVSNAAVLDDHGTKDSVLHLAKPVEDHSMPFGRMSSTVSRPSSDQGHFLPVSSKLQSWRSLVLHEHGIDLGPCWLHWR